MSIQFKKFSQFTKKLAKSDYDIDNLNLSSEDINFLQNEIDRFTSNQLQETHRILEKYYLMQVPDALIKTVLKNDLSLACEAYDETIGDTFPRDILIDSILKQIGIPSWPANSDSDDYREKFVQKLHEKAPEFGITILTKKHKPSI